MLAVNYHFCVLYYKEFSSCQIRNPGFDPSVINTVPRIRPIPVVYIKNYHRKVKKL